MVDHSQHQLDQGFTVSTALSAMAIGGIVVAGAVIMAPHVLPSIGIGSATMARVAFDSLHEARGIAGGLNNILAAVPNIGSKLAEGGFFNAVTTALVGIGGTVVGEHITSEEAKHGQEQWGRLITYAALATSALIAMPTVLTALGSGIIFLATVVGDASISGPVISFVNSTIGTMAGVDHPILGTSGIVAAIPHLLTCGMALLPATLTAQLWKNGEQEEAYVALDTKGNPLPDHDPNHQMTKEEIALTEQYNQAPPAKKILLKKQILDQGYDPDFHSNGTVHLYKHTHHDIASMSR